MKKYKLKQIICLVLYYSIAYYLPVSHSRPFGSLSKKIRQILCKGIFHKCGKNVNIERKVYFGNGLSLEIGDNSGLGVNCVIPNIL